MQDQNVQQAPEIKNRPRWLPNFDRSDLLHLGIAIWLIVKQWLALRMVHLAPGSTMVMASAGAILFLSAWVRRAVGRKQAFLWLLLDFVVTLILYADVIYYRQFGDLVSIASIRQVGQLGTVSDSVAVLMRPKDLFLWADLPVLAVLLWAVPARVHMEWLRPMRNWAIRFVALTGIVIVTVIAVANPILAQQYYGHTMVSRQVGLINYHAFDIGTYAKRLSARVGPQTEEVRAVRDFFESRQDLPPAAERPYFGLAKGKNVILVQLESFQSFPIGMKIDGQEITPNLNRLMGESLYYTNFYHQTGQGVTSDADLIGNCSLLPTRTGAVYYDYASNNFRCSPTVLRDNGYSAVAMQGMPADFWNLSAVYPQVGFERYFSLRDFSPGEKIGIGLSDESLFRQAVPKLKQLKEPYYAYLVTLTSHGPFDFADLPRTLKLGALEGTKTGAYLHAVHYTDMALGQFVDRLKAEGILDDAVLVVYGDHQGIWRWEPGMQELLGLNDEVSWTQAEKRVPLLIRVPDATLKGEQKQTAGQADIAPTIAGLLGIPSDQTWFIGRDLLATSSGVVAFYRGSAIDDQHLYLSPDDAETPMCYSIATRQPVDVTECGTMGGEANLRLAISRMIIERNLIPLLGKE